jgi:hypothetical protein
MMVMRAVVLFLAVAFAALIVWAIQTGDFWAEGSWLTRNPWGIVSLTDLYLGFLVVAVFMYVIEPGSARWFWIIPLPFLGNVWTLIWLAWRLPALINRFRHNSLV